VIRVFGANQKNVALQKQRHSTFVLWQEQRSAKAIIAQRMFASETRHPLPGTGRNAVHFMVVGGRHQQGGAPWGELGLVASAFNRRIL
jgi:hypothetical protein